MKKNVASQKIGAQMVSATDGSAFTGSVTVSVTGDAGTQATGSVGSGACTHEGNGYHTYAPAQAETNYDLVAFTFTGTGAVPTTVQIFTFFPQTGDNYARIGAPAGASVSADIAAVKADTAAVKTKTDFLPSATAGAAGGVFIAGTNAATSITTALTANITGNLSGSVGSVTGAVGSVTGAVGSVTGAVGSVGSGGISSTSFAAGAITASAIAADAIGASELAADAIAEIADAVWDEAQAGHVTAGSFGETATEIASILADTNELQTDWVNGGRLDLILDARASQTTADDILTDTGTTIPAQITALNNISAAQVNAEVDTALADIHLDHLLAVTYDPATKPGAADALLNEIVESDAGVARFTANALEQGPGGGSAPTAAQIADAVWDEAQADHVGAGTFGEIATEIAAVLVDTAEIGAAGAGLTALATQASVNTIDGIVDSILDDTGTSGVAISTTGISAIWAYAVEGSYTAVQYMRGMASVLFGKSSGLAGTAPTFRDTADTKARVTGTVDASGNRSAVTLDLT